MILLDTNVISELLTGPDESPVLDWRERLDETEFAMSAVTLMEIVHGIERMPDGRKRTALTSAWEEFTSHWPGRILPFTALEATAAGHVLARRTQMGRPVGIADAQIAGSALVNRAIIATRNTRDFERLGIDLVDPWQ